MSCQDKNIGIMGGTFDPIHIGHLAIAQEAMEYKNLDKVIFIPNGNPPHKNLEKRTDKKIRFYMVKKAILDNEDFFIEDYEIKKDTPSYSLDTIKYIKDKYDNANIFFIMGEDSLLNIETWYEYDKFLNMVTILVAQRNKKNNSKLDEKVKNLQNIGYNIDIIPSKYLDISATNIRKKIKLGENPRYYLTEDVYRFIIKEGLYL